MRSVKDKAIDLIAGQANFKETTGVSKTRCTLLNSLAKAVAMGAFTMVLYNSHAQAGQTNSVTYNNGNLVQAEEVAPVQVQQAPVELLVPQQIKPVKVEQERTVRMIVPEQVEMRVPEQVSVQLVTPGSVEQRKIQDENTRLLTPEVEVVAPNQRGSKF